MPAQGQRNDAWTGMGVGWSVTSTMIGGIAAWGGLGFLADRWLGTGHVLFTIGTVLGAAGATYLVWLRYGRGEGGES
jgi:F0F1-type ATP synthase assembly protein I